MWSIRNASGQILDWVFRHAPSHEGSGADVLSAKNLGVVHPLSSTFVSAAGAAGNDNTAETVKMVVVPANTLTQNGDRIRIRVYWRGDTGGGITATLTLNGVILAASTDAGGTDEFVDEAYVHYIDATHANIIETGVYPATRANTAINSAGLDWTSAQDIDVDQDAVVNNHIVIHGIFIDVFPKGIV